MFEVVREWFNGVRECVSERAYEGVREYVRECVKVCKRV